MSRLPFLKEYGGQTIDEIDPKLHENDERYYQSIEPIIEPLFSYIEQHRSEIRIPHVT